MAEDLRYGNKQSIGVCDYANDPNCTQGRLYSWSQALGIDPIYDHVRRGYISGTSYLGICPDGWKIPDTSDILHLLREGGNMAMLANMDTAGIEPLYNAKGLRSEIFKNIPNSITFFRQKTFGFWLANARKYPRLNNFQNFLTQFHNGGINPSRETAWMMMLLHSQQASSYSQDEDNSAIYPEKKEIKMHVRCVEDPEKHAQKDPPVSEEDQGKISIGIMNLITKMNLDSQNVSVEIAKSGWLFNVDGKWVDAIAVGLAVDNSVGNMELTERIQALFIRENTGEFRLDAYSNYNDLHIDYIDFSEQTIHAFKYVYTPDDPRCCPSLKSGFYLRKSPSGVLFPLRDQYPASRT